jgi:hypothetical protein
MLTVASVTAATPGDVGSGSGGGVLPESDEPQAASRARIMIRTGIRFAIGLLLRESVA